MGGIGRGLESTAGGRRRTGDEGRVLSLEQRIQVYNLMPLSYSLISLRIQRRGAPARACKRHSLGPFFSRVPRVGPPGLLPSWAGYWCRRHLQESCSHSISDNFITGKNISIVLHSSYSMAFYFQLFITNSYGTMGGRGDA